MRLIRRFMELRWEDRLLLAESVASLAIARLALVVLPFRPIGRWASVEVTKPAPLGEARAANLRRVRWAVTATARRVPWRAMCFEQGLSAQFMLRRRRIATRLFYGAAFDDGGGLIAHVWVKDGDRNIVGGEIASRFTVLATFPARLGDVGAGKHDADAAA